ncbi:hypothetical protein [Escherichia coli]|uniref:hypothetical protein n=1 Tax=Escherichia coli TaxID=562 RepID=UPI003CF146D2
MSNKYEDLIKSARMNADCGEHMSPAEVTTLLNVVEAKCAALAAELSAIEAIHNDAVFITDEHYEQCPPEVQKMIRSLAVMQIPAYKSFLAEVRAHDLNAFIRHHSAELDAHIKNGGEQFDEKSVRIRDIIVSARLFREQIRKEAAQ